MNYSFSDGTELSRQRKRIYYKRKRRQQRAIRGFILLFMLIMIVGFGLYKVNALIKEFTKDSSDYDKVSEAETTTLEDKAVNNEGKADNFSRSNQITAMGLTGEYLELANAINTDLSELEGIETIITNIRSYPIDLLEQLIRNPEIIGYALGFLEDHPVGGSINIGADYVQGEIPLFIQWDKRWGYETYADNKLGLNGCGPTCLAMVYVGLTGDISKNPLEIAKFSTDNGYYEYGIGTMWSLMGDGARELGLSVSELGLDREVILNHLSMGHPIIVSVGPGDFTAVGHFIVMTGLDDNGEVIVNDPNSNKRSNKTWDIDTILSQTKNLWVFS